MTPGLGTGLGGRDPDPKLSLGGHPYLDQALWARFRSTETPEAFASAWLALQCRHVEGATAGVLVLGEPDVGPFRPAAAWPDAAALSPALASAAEEAVRRRQGIATPEAEPCVAAPLTVEGRLVGVAAVALGAEASPAQAMRQLQWGAGWIEALIRREQGLADAEMRTRMTGAFDLLGVVLEQETAKAGATALATELARRLEADPVSIGFRRGGGTRVQALSHAAWFADRMSLVRDIGAAMDEAVDQRAIILHPAREGWEYRVTRAHEDLAAAHRVGHVLTVPLRHDGQVFGAITLERPAGRGFDPATVALVDAVAAVVGPVLFQRRANDRWLPVKIWQSLATQLKRLLGAGYFGRKLATVGVVALVAFFAVARGEYAVTAPATLEGRIQRSVVAPFPGYIATEHAKAGEIVQEGQILARLDDQDLRLERLRLVTQRSQRQTEYDRALAGRQRAEAAIARSQIDQAEAQLALVEEQLARTRIVAPFAGVVVRGNLSQRVGGAVERGEELFQIAPLDAYRVILEVDEGDIADIRIGQQGTAVLASLPDAPQPYRVERITPIAEQNQGRNFFRVEAALEGTNERLRPSMVGVGRTAVEERLLISIWTRRLIDWLRVAAWRWTP
jgi:RND family efflux transporter MFP subunit